jgi:hypothetical protein
MTDQAVTFYETEPAKLVVDGRDLGMSFEEAIRVLSATESPKRIGESESESND